MSSLHISYSSGGYTVTDGGTHKLTALTSDEQLRLRADYASGEYPLAEVFQRAERRRRPACKRRPALAGAG